MLRPNLGSSLSDAISSKIEPVGLMGYRLLGNSAKWVLSEAIPLVDSDIVHLSFKGGVFNSGTDYFIGDPSYRFALFAAGTEENLFDGYGANSTINDVEIVHEVTPIPYTGNHELAIDVSRSGILTVIGSRDVDSGSSVATVLYNFKVERNGVIIHDIPLTNKAQGATQLPVVGNISATVTEYDGSAWEEL